MRPVDARAFFHALAPDFALVAQRGDDLGARLSHAFEDLLADGAPGAIVIGSDVPTLPSAVLGAALERLAGADLVLGPSEDGGYYLIGLREPRAALFADMAWSTAVVFEETMRRASALGLDVGLLPAWFDVDTAADLERLEASLAAPGSGARHTRRFFARAAGGGQAVTPEIAAPHRGAGAHGPLEAVGALPERAAMGHRARGL